MSERDIDTSSENVLSDWARAARDDREGQPEVDEPEVDEPEEAPDADELVAASSVGDEPADEDASTPAWGTAAAQGGDAAQDAHDEDAGAAGLSAGDDSSNETAEPLEGHAGEEPEQEAADGDEPLLFPVELSHEHAAGEVDIPDGYAVLEGAPEGGRRAVGVVVARFNGEVTTRLLARALEELGECGVRQEAITVMVVPGAFELPLAATALAKTRRFACVVALGCIIRGDTPHFDYVASEAASGLQLAALETGVPVSFGVLTLDRVEQAEPRIEKGAEAVRSALEMADLFAHLRAAASR
jgi:6,7-dimethyl-8-ribityllumazine synthase